MAVRRRESLPTIRRPMSRPALEQPCHHRHVVQLGARRQASCSTSSMTPTPQREQYVTADAGETRRLRLSGRTSIRAPFRRHLVDMYSFPCQSPGINRRRAGALGVVGEELHHRHHVLAGPPIRFDQLGQRGTSARKDCRGARRRSVSADELSPSRIALASPRGSRWMTVSTRRRHLARPAAARATSITSCFVRRADHQDFIDAAGRALGQYPCPAAAALRSASAPLRGHR